MECLTCEGRIPKRKKGKKEEGGIKKGGGGEEKEEIEKQNKSVKIKVRNALALEQE